MNYPLSYQEFQAIYSKVPRLNVEVVIEAPEGVVLTKRTISPYKGLWHLPGGTVYFGESLRQAVQRVAKDELGVDVTIGAQLGYIEYPSAAEEVDFAGWPIGIAFQAEVTGGELVAREQASEVKYFKQIPEDTIREQKMFLESNQTA